MLKKMCLSILKLTVLCSLLIDMNLPLIASNYSSILSNALEEKSTNECSIALYTQENLMGGSVIISNNGTNVDIQEHSAETIGYCCWRVYRYH